VSSISFDEQVAIVTGAGGGLGKTYALELARRGAKVVVNDLGGGMDGTGSGSAPADATVSEIASLGGEAIANTDSVASREGGAAIVKSALDAFGRVDILINNAGILRDKSFLNVTPEDFDAVLDVHLRGAFHVTQAAFGHMKGQGYGRILFTTSGSGLFGNFGQVNYSAAKMGLVGLCNTVAIEGAKSGILANCIAPIARTRMTEELLGPMASKLDAAHITPLALFLVSRECTLTHEIFTAAAGWYARVPVVVTPGWYVGTDQMATVEDIHDNLGEIRSEDGYFVPVNADGALAVVAKYLQ
jgi:NAD(P)-dependent dehydrogenase (short-subunit alcohol dehydrogenase family)